MKIYLEVITMQKSIIFHFVKFFRDNYSKRAKNCTEEEDSRVGQGINEPRP